MESTGDRLTQNQYSFSMLGKRKAIDEGVELSRSLVKNYTNFLKSLPPKRILFHENGEWNDFPQGLVESVREEFMMKKAVIEMRFDEINVLLDLLYMVQVELITGSMKPIAWIDEAGGCYFPELSSSNAQVRQLCFEIDVNGLNNPNSEECVEESNVGSKRVKVEQESVGKADEFIYKEKTMPKTYSNPKLLDTNGIRNLFHTVMKPFVNISVLGVDKIASNMLSMRYELFQKQVELINKYRGISNVRYAWFPCSRDTVSSITSYGLWKGGNNQKIKYGNGVHLNAVKCAYRSATYCDVDEKGLYRMVFCRVILGNPEVLQPGSQQFHPSRENFDSGVDDLRIPRCYIIWNMNASTRIFPEYVITFKMLSGAKDYVGLEENKLNQSPRGAFQIGHPSFNKGRSHKYEEARGAVGTHTGSINPPAMRFDLLFKAIEDKVSAEYMNLVYEQYELFKCKKINRDEFIVKLRKIVGDQLLRSTITGFQDKMLRII